MLIRESFWEKVRDKFSETEKIELRKAMEGEVVCPKGWMINLMALSDQLRDKMLKLLGFESR